MSTSPMTEPGPLSDRAIPASAPRTLARAVPLTYGTIVICFLFTFVNISCQGQRFVSLNGLQLAFGTTIETQTMFGGAEKKKLPAEPLVAGALLAAVAGFVLSIRRIGRRKAAAVMGGIGFVLLLIYKSNTDDAVLRQGGTFQVDYGGGFIMAVMLFAVAALLASGLADRLLRRAGGQAP